MRRSDEEIPEPYPRTYSKTHLKPYYKTGNGTAASYNIQTIKRCGDGFVTMESEYVGNQTDESDCYEDMEAESEEPSEFLEEGTLESSEYEELYGDHYGEGFFGGGAN